MNAELKSRPILFSGEMVKAIIEGRKTQTRRVINPQPLDWAKRFEPAPFNGYGKSGDWIQMTQDAYKQVGLGRCPYGAPGDFLWVRETWAAHPMQNKVKPRDLPENYPFIYKADLFADNKNFWWRPSIHMPRSASRITLRVVNVRVERVQEISKDDILAEGINAHFVPRRKDPLPTPRSAFAQLWDTINKDRGFGWDVNPWVWVVEFRAKSIIDDPIMKKIRGE